MATVAVFEPQHIEQGISHDEVADALKHGDPYVLSGTNCAGAVHAIDTRPRHRRRLAANSRAGPTQGPDVVWENKVGQGYAGPAVVGDRVILFDRVGDVERVQALSTTDGQQLWLTEFAATYRGGMNPDESKKS